MLTKLGHPGLQTALMATSSLVPTPVLSVTSPSGDAGDPPNITTAQVAWLFEYAETAKATVTGSPVPFSFGDTGKLNGFFMQKTNVGQARLRHFVESGNAAQFYYDAYATTLLNCRSKNAVSINADGSIMLARNGAITARKASITKPASYDDGVSVGRYSNAASSNTWSSGTAYLAQVFGRGLSEDELIAATRPTVAPLDAGTYPPQSTAKGIAFPGQSNASGRGGTSYPTYTNQERMKKLPLNFSYGDYADPANANTGSLITGLDDSGAQLGADGYTMDEILSARPDIPFLCAIPCSVPSTGWGIHWGPQITNTAITNSDANIKHLGASMQATIERLVAANFIVPIEAVVFHLGEYDSTTAVATTSAVIQAQATLAVPLLRKALNKPNLPIIFVGMHAWHADLAASITQALWEQKIVDYQAVAANFLNVFAVDISDLDGTVGDRVHLTAASQQTKGQRIAAILKNLL
jgi:hypothetical protein